MMNEIGLEVAASLERFYDPTSINGVPSHVGFFAMPLYDVWFDTPRWW
jgi:hypothetical protein